MLKLNSAIIKATYYGTALGVSNLKNVIIAIQMTPQLEPAEQNRIFARCSNAIRIDE